MLLTDKFGRAITDLRLSITDRCNYRCVYCRTGNEGALYGDLPFADYLRMARVLVGMGITKIRLTGGEPLLRKDVIEFVRELAKLRPQGLKPAVFLGDNGAAKAVPFPTPSREVPFDTISWPRWHSRSRRPGLRESRSRWTQSIRTASPASPGSRTDTITYLAVFAPHGAQDCGR
jgi:hypothetical protein